MIRRKHRVDTPITQLDQITRKPSRVGNLINRIGNHSRVIANKRSDPGKARRDRFNKRLRTI